MVYSNNPIDLLMMKIEVMNKDYKALQKIIKQGFFSERFGSYAERLLILDNLLEEVKTFIDLGDIKRATLSCSEMRGHLDFIAGIYLSNKPLIKDKTLDLWIVKDPDFNNIRKYNELFEFANQRYEEAIKKIKESEERRNEKEIFN